MIIAVRIMTLLFNFGLNGWKIALEKYSNINIEASVISALTRRAKLVYTKNDYLAEELQYIKKTMMLNGYPKSFIEKEI